MMMKSTCKILTLLLLACCCHSFGASESAGKGTRVELREAPSADALEQKMLAMSADGGGVLLLPKNSTITATIHSLKYKNWESTHALLVPEHVTVDLNGSTILLDCRSNGYGIRLTSWSAIQNGKVRVIHSEGSGAQGIWHCCVSVGAAYGDGGTPDNPSYFSKLAGWRMENLDVEQPFARATISIMSEAYQGVIRNIRVADSPLASNGVGLDWGTVGPLGMADELQPKMRTLFEQGKVYGTPCHDILIQKIRIGRLGANENDDYSCGVRTSGCYNITIDDVEIQAAAAGVAIHAGDAGFEYTLEPHRHIGHAGFVIKNIRIHQVYRRGIIIDGIADNVYRATVHYGHHAMLNPLTPGIDKALVQHATVVGGPSAEIGVMVQFATGTKIEDVDVAQFRKGFHLKDWSKNVSISQCKIHDNGSALVVTGSEGKPENIVLKRSHIYRNSNGIQAAEGQVKEIGDVYHE